MTIVTPPDTKPCARCQQVLPLDSFGRAPRMALGRSSYCRPCSAAKARERYAKDPEKVRAVQRAYATRTRTPERTRARHLWSLYRLTVDEYDAMLAAQDNRCAICKTDEPGGKGNWHVDHCHNSTRVRALLCAGCNVGIALLKHDPERLRAAADYLERHQGES